MSVLQLYRKGSCDQTLPQWKSLWNVRLILNPTRQAIFGKHTANMNTWLASEG